MNAGPWLSRPATQADGACQAQEYGDDRAIGRRGSRVGKEQVIIRAGNGCAGFDVDVERLPGRSMERQQTALSKLRLPHDKTIIRIVV